MAKKRKLNSKNPKWIKNDKKDIDIRKEFIREIRGVKVYALFSK
jgi:hypothetical protein